MLSLECRRVHVKMDTWKDKGKDFQICFGSSYLSFPHGQIWATALKSSYWWRQLNEWEVLLAPRLHLPCPAESEGSNFVPVVAGLSLPQRDMFLCRKGSCHFGRCPIHLVRVGSCFGFRSCCKLWVLCSVRFIQSRQTFIAHVFNPKVPLHVQIGHKKKIICHEDRLVLK